MATPKDVLWDKDPHTEAKHRIYRAYFDAWFPILLQSEYAPKGVTYAEGFSGPGEYKDGSPGSPAIALQAALGSIAPPNPRRPARFLLVDGDAARIAHLRGILENDLGALDVSTLARRGLVVDIEGGACTETLPQMLDRHRAWGKPMLVILDTWGSAVNFELLRRIGTSRAAEAIVTIEPSQFVRFAADPNHYGDRIFGPVVWRDVQGQPSRGKASYIKKQYRRVLNEAGFRYVLDFELADEKSNLLYLVYGTNSERGVEKMKDAIWTVDPYHGLGYRDPRDPAQETLAIEAVPQTAALRRLILDRMNALPDGKASVDLLRQFVLLETIYRPAQTLKAVQRLVDEQLLIRCDGGRLTRTSVVKVNNQETMF
jgi:three-Cys-motif partner protein